MSQENNDATIEKLHSSAIEPLRKMERLVDQLKCAGPHSWDGKNAIQNVRNQLLDLSKR